MGRILMLRWAEEASKVSYHPIFHHASLLKQGFLSHTSIANTVLSLYFRHRDVKAALGIFRSMESWSRDSVSWNIAVHGFFTLNQFENGLRWFNFARRDMAFLPNVSTLVILLHACSNRGNKNTIEQAHAYLTKSGFISSLSLCNSLLQVYGGHRSKKVFEEMPEKDIVSWSLVINHYAKSGNPSNALDCFRSMILQNTIKVDAMLLVTVLYACARVDHWRLATSTHGISIRHGVDDLYLRNVLIDAYSKWGRVDMSFKIFTAMNVRNQVSWNSMLSAFVNNQYFHEATGLLRRLAEEVSSTDDVTLVNILKLSKQFANSCWAKTIHCHMIRRGNSNYIVINSLIDAYASCNLVDEAYEIFARLEKKDMIMWSTMIAAFGRNGKACEAIAVFEDMKREEKRANSVAVLNLIKACGLSGVPRWCKWVHGVALRGGYAWEVTVGTAILNMYSKSGDVESGRRVFEKMARKSMVTWSAMIDGCARNGEGRAALGLWREMREEGYRGNWVTVLSVLSACRHEGLVREGVSVLKEAKVQLRGEHFACVADMLGKVGMCHVAADVMRKSEGAETGWGAVLSGSRSYGNMTVGEEAYGRLVEMEPLGYAGYVVWSGMASSNGAWGEAEQIRLTAEQIRLAAALRGPPTAPAYSCLYSAGEFHTFVAGHFSKFPHTLLTVLGHLHVHSTSHFT